MRRAPPNGEGPGLKAWIFSFECSGIVKVGGLAEVTRNQAAALAAKGVDVTLILPCHGRLSGSRLVGALGDGVTAYETRLDGCRTILLSGGALDDPIVYERGVAEAKAALSARAARGLANLIGWPSLVHVNDWHGVPFGLAVRQSADEAGLGVAVVFQVHLYLAKWVGWDYLFGECGLSPSHETRCLNGGWRRVSLGEVYRESDGVLERVGAAVADRLVTVSEAYLRGPGGLLHSVGWRFEPKSTYVYNGTDWSLEKLYSQVARYHGEALGGVHDPGLWGRRVLRSYLLTRALDGVEPIIEDPQLRALVDELRGSIEVRRLQPFPGDGPLILSSGRASRQKGFDVLLEAAQILFSAAPNLRLLLFLIPVRGEEHHLRHLYYSSCVYPRNVRLVVGRAPTIYELAYLAADVFVVPSRWEPFGLTALEAMAAGVPVVASRTGGLSETIIDVREDASRGTGMLVEPENPRQLAGAIATMLLLMAREDLVGYAERLAGLCLEAPELSAGEIRRNCVNRVEVSFRWDKTVDALKSVYLEAVRARSAVG